MGDRRGRQVGPQGSAIRVLTALRGWPSRHGKGLGLPGISALTARGGRRSPRLGSRCWVPAAPGLCPRAEPPTREPPGWTGPQVRPLRTERGVMGK